MSISIPIPERELYDSENNKFIDIPKTVLGLFQNFFAGRSKPDRFVRVNEKGSRNSPKRIVIFLFHTGLTCREQKRI